MHPSGQALGTQLLLHVGGGVTERGGHAERSSITGLLLRLPQWLSGADQEPGASFGFPTLAQGLKHLGHPLLLSHATSRELGQMDQKSTRAWN